MKISPKLLSVFLLIVLSSASWARINETLEECIKRYGQEGGPTDVAPGKATYWFYKSDYQILATFVDGRVAIISFRKPGRLSDSEVEMLLEANRVNGQVWEEVNRDSETARWSNISNDIAVLTPKYGLQIRTAEGFKAAQERDNAKTKDNLEGF